MAKQIIMLPSNNRLRQLITDHGDIWEVIKGPKGMSCFNGQLGMAIQSLDGTHTRNIPIESTETL